MLGQVLHFLLVSCLATTLAVAHLNANVPQIVAAVCWLMLFVATVRFWHVWILLAFWAGAAWSGYSYADGQQPLFGPTLVCALAVVATYVCHDANCLSDRLRYLIHIRVPLFFAAALLLFPVFATQSDASKYLFNLLEIDERRLCGVTFIATWLAWSVLVATEIVTRYRHLRIEIEEWLPMTTAIRSFVDRFKVFIFGMLGWAIPIAIASVNAKPWTSDLWYIFLGCAGAHLLLVLAVALREVLADGEPPLKTYTIFGRADKVVFKPRRDHGVDQRSHFAAVWTRAMLNSLGPGYRIAGNNDRTARPVVAHISALALFIVTICIYFVVLYLRSDLPLSSPLAYVLLLVLFISWLLSAAAFFLDRWSIPTLATVLLLSWVSHNSFGLYHYFRLIPQAKSTVAADDLDVAISAFAGKQPVGKRKAIIVCASGGGIRASCWTAKVMTELESTLKTDFTSRLFAISAVSGGSVGTMHYLGGFDRMNARPTSIRGDQECEIVQSASKSCLEPLAWSIAGRDFWRSGVTPLFRAWAFMMKTPHYLDRNYELEEHWQREIQSRYSNQITLLQQRSAIRAGEAPIPIYNSVIVESGQPMIFSPLKLKSEANELFPRYKTFHEVYKGKADIRLVTAARHSATFPWVTPVSRAYNEGTESAWTRQDSKGNDQEDFTFYADGGYFDNDGIATGIQLLRRIQPILAKNQIDDVLILQVVAHSLDPRLTKTQRTRAAMATFGPIISASSARWASQTSRNESEFAAAQQFMASHQMRLTRVQFELRDQEVLSWSLSNRERQKILDQFTAKHNEGKVELVRSFLQQATGSEAPESDNNGT